MIEIVRTLDQDNWSQFVYDHPDGNIFHTPEMFQVYERAAKHKPTLWAAVETRSNGGSARGAERILALFLPVEITVVGGPFRRLTTRAVVFGSVLSEPGSEGERALDQLLQAYRQEVDGRLLFTELRNIVPLDGLQPVLEKHGFAYEDHLNYLVDLDRPTEEIMQSISRRTRRRIRRGLRGGEVVVDEVQDRETLVECYALLSHTYAAAEVPLADISLFAAALDILRPRGMIRFFLGRVDGRPAACSVDLLYKDRSYGWYGGTDREFSSLSPTEIITWNVFEWSAKNGYRLYDFGGAGKPDEEYGVRDFKAKFGGDLVCYGRNVCVHSPVLLQASKVGYNVARRLGFFSSTPRAEDGSSPTADDSEAEEAEAVREGAIEGGRETRTSQEPEHRR